MSISISTVLSSVGVRSCTGATWYCCELARQSRSETALHHGTMFQLPLLALESRLSCSNGCELEQTASRFVHFRNLNSHAAVSLSGSCDDAACDLDAADFSFEPLHSSSKIIMALNTESGGCLRHCCHPCHTSKTGRWHGQHIAMKGLNRLSCKCPPSCAARDAWKVDDTQTRPNGLRKLLLQPGIVKVGDALLSYLAKFHETLPVDAIADAKNCNFDF